MRIKIYLIIFFLLSFSFNIVFVTLYLDDSKVNENECYCFPRNVCSDNHVHGLNVYDSVFSGFSPHGEPMEFIKFRLSGTLSESYEKKYGKPLSRNIVRNIQHLSYFFLGNEIRFYRGDELQFYLRKKDSRILYMRFRSRYKNAEYEAVLFPLGNRETYVLPDGMILVPCIKNGPFPQECPDVNMTLNAGQFETMFIFEKKVDVILPFASRINYKEQNQRTGGVVNFKYSDFNVSGVLKGLSKIDNQLREKTLYKKGRTVGTTGFLRKKEGVGLVYSLRRGGKSVSPFEFHHTERNRIPGKSMDNFRIFLNYYRYWYKKAMKNILGRES